MQMKHLFRQACITTAAVLSSGCAVYDGTPGYTGHVGYGAYAAPWHAYPPVTVVPRPVVVYPHYHRASPRLQHHFRSGPDYRPRSYGQRPLGRSPEGFRGRYRR